MEGVSADWGTGDELGDRGIEGFGCREGGTEAASLGAWAWGPCLFGGSAVGFL